MIDQYAEQTAAQLLEFVEQRIRDGMAAAEPIRSVI